MVERTYLPFQSAREYQDAGMQKWMGFFLSEHTAALADDSIRMPPTPALSLDTKLLQARQLYSSQLASRIEISVSGTQSVVFGTIQRISKDSILIKTKTTFLTILLEQIVSIQLDKESLEEINV